MVDPNLLIGLSMLTTGLVLGAIFALTAAGVTIVYGCIWLPNAASGQFFLLAPLVAWSLCTAMGWPPILAVAGGAHRWRAVRVSARAPADPTLLRRAGSQYRVFRGHARHHPDPVGYLLDHLGPVERSVQHSATGRGRNLHRAISGACQQIDCARRGAGAARRAVCRPALPPLRTGAARGVPESRGSGAARR